VMVTFGFDETGMGMDQQEQPAPAEPLPQPVPSRQEPKEEDYLVQDIEEAPAIKEKKVEEKKKEPEKIIPEPEPEPVKEVITEPVPEPKPQPNPKAMYKGKSTTTVQGGQEGQTGQPGDQGNPNGTPGAPTYTGTGGEGSGTGSGTGTGSGKGGDGAGDGVSYDLGGRGSLMLHKPSYDSKEQGKVVVTIKVDKLGNVSSAVAGAKGTNVSDQTLWQLAKDAALRSRFVADPNAPDIQVGTITYNFIRQN
jgi:protein TonB